MPLTSSAGSTRIPRGRPPRFVADRVHELVRRERASSGAPFEHPRMNEPERGEAQRDAHRAVGHGLDTLRVVPRARGDVRGLVGGKLDEDLVRAIDVGQVRVERAVQDVGEIEVGGITFASHLVMRGAPIKAVQELMGHSTILMMMRYVHLAPEVARDAVLQAVLDGDYERARRLAEEWRRLAANAPVLRTVK